MSSLKTIYQSIREEVKWHDLAKTFCGQINLKSPERKICSSDFSITVLLRVFSNLNHISKMST